MDLNNIAWMGGVFFVGILTLTYMMMRYMKSAQVQSVSKENLEKIEKYLEKFNDMDKVLNEFKNLNSNVTKLEDIEKKLNKLDRVVEPLSQSEKREIISSIQNHVESQAYGEYFKDLGFRMELLQFTTPEYKAEELEKFVEKKLREPAERFLVELEHLRARLNTNLLIAFVIASLTGFTAFMTILDIAELFSISKPVQFFSYFFPRFSFLFLLSFLTYFFLNLYKSGLSDIKYYQNEITNLEARYLSLQMARTLGSQETLNMVLENIVKTERNFILKKGQTTVELEKEKIDIENKNQFFDIIKGLIKVKN